jgi:hypothetical protein
MDISIYNMLMILVVVVSFAFIAVVHILNREKSGDKKLSNKYKYKIEGKSISEQIRSREFFDSLKESISFHEPTSEKGKALSRDVIGTLGTFPFVVIIVLCAVLITILMIIFI